MIYRAEVFVTLKPVVNDPAGLTIRGGLHALGFDSVTDVRAGKYLVVTLDADDEGQASSRVEDMTQQLLANGVIEDYRIELQPEPEAALAGSQIPLTLAEESREDSRSPLAGEGRGGGS